MVKLITPVPAKAPVQYAQLYEEKTLEFYGEGFTNDDYHDIEMLEEETMDPVFDETEGNLSAAESFGEWATEEEWAKNGYTIARDTDIDIDHLHWDFFPGAGSFLLFDPTANAFNYMYTIKQQLFVTAGTHPSLRLIFDDDDKKAMEDRKPTESGIEIVAAAIYLNAYFRIVDVNSN
jgi:hypothetical protein